MKNTFNSTHTNWTEIALSGGWIEVMGTDEALTEAEQSRLNHIKAFGVANSYIRRSHSLYVADCLKKILCQRWPGSTD